MSFSALKIGCIVGIYNIQRDSMSFAEVRHIWRESTHIHLSIKFYKSSYGANIDIDIPLQACKQNSHTLSNSYMIVHRVHLFLAACKIESTIYDLD